MELKYVRDKYVRLSDLLYAVLDRIGLLIIVGIACVVLSFGAFYMVGRHNVSAGPSYEAALEVYVSCPLDKGSEITYSDIAVSDDALEKIIKNENLNMTKDEVWNCIYSQTDQENTVKFTVISDSEDTTRKIIDGLTQYSFPTIENYIPNSTVRIVKNPASIKKVKSFIGSSEYSQVYLTLKGVPTDSIQDWSVYSAEQTNVVSLLKKSVVIAFIVVFLMALVLMIMNIFSRKLRYPDEYREATGIRVLLTVAADKTGLGCLLQTINDSCKEGGKILVFSAHKGEGVSMVCESLRESLSEAGKSVEVIDAPSIEASPSVYDMAGEKDTVIMVNEPGSLDDIQLNKIREGFTANGADITGIVLNKVKVNKIGRKKRYLGTYYIGE